VEGSATTPQPSDPGIAVRVSVTNLSDAVEFLRTRAGFDLLRIHPADAPREARMTRGRTVLDLTASATASGILIVVEGPGPAHEIQGPDGIVVRTEPGPSLVVPPVVEETSIGSGDADGEWHVGRAGMEYRDLVPSRFGGSIIASNIRISDAGPVPDYVHHHDVLFQLIFCRRGWVKVVYEDQGEPFVLHAGDCVIQPPGIRHRVLENSDGMEVVEIGYPAEHMTFVEHDIRLPNGFDPNRSWFGQMFVRHAEASRVWSALDTGVRRTDTGVHVATNGLADVDVLRLSAGSSVALPAEPVGPRPRLVFVVSGEALARTGDDEGTLVEGATLALSSDDTATVTATVDTVLLRITIDASRDPSYWRPIA